MLNYAKVMFIRYKDKEILLIDFSNCNIEEGLQIIEKVKNIISQQPEHSLLTLTDVSGSRYNKEVVRRLKDLAEFNRPHVKAGAVVGVSGLKKVVYDTIMRFTKRTMPVFATREEALEWLIIQ